MSSHASGKKTIIKKTNINKIKMLFKCRLKMNDSYVYSIKKSLNVFFKQDKKSEDVPI